MDEIQSQIDDLNDSLSDVSDNQTQDETTLDDHENRIGSVEDTTENIDPNRINQLNFPLDQDSIDLIASAVNTSVIASGSVTLVAGSFTGSNSLIKSSSIIVVSGVNFSSGATYRAGCFAGGFNIISSSGSDTNVVNYIIIL